MSSAEIRRVLGTPRRYLNPSDYVGFDSLPNQLVDKTVERGFEFNLLCVGETGVGKSALLDSLFKDSFPDEPVSHELPEVTFNAKTYMLTEGLVNLKLTLVSTEGYGDQVNRKTSIQSILDYLDQQFESYLKEEMQIERDLLAYHDTRIHACLYFIYPTGRFLKSLDLLCMKELQKKVNVIPIIAKADTITTSELADFKRVVREELAANGIQIYQCPSSDGSVAASNERMNREIPFAVVGSREKVKMHGRTIRARQYPWGIVEVENEHHGNLAKLRRMLFSENMDHLLETTHLEHYESYRTGRLGEMGLPEGHGPNERRKLYQCKYNEHVQHLNDLEGNLRGKFVQKVRRKEEELRAIEESLMEEFEQFQRPLLQQREELEREAKKLEDEKSYFLQYKDEVTAKARAGKK